MSDDIFTLEQPPEPSPEAKQLGVDDKTLDTLVDLAMIQDVKTGKLHVPVNIPMTKHQKKKREASKRARQARKKNRK